MKKVFKIIIYVLIITLFLQKIYLAKNSQDANKIRRNILISFVPYDCEFENGQYLFLVPDCNDYKPGTMLELDGYIGGTFSNKDTLFDIGFLNKKRLIVESIRVLKKKVVSLEFWFEYLVFVFHVKKTAILGDLLPLFSVPGEYLAGRLGFNSTQVRSREIDHLFKITGMQYLASISGFHLNFIVRLFGKIVNRFFKNKSASLFSLLVSLAYLLFIGPKLPLVRGFLMLVLSITSTKFLFRQNNSIYTLCLVAIYLIYADITIINKVSFQLSFVATASIIFFARSFRSNNLVNLYTSDFIFNKKTRKKTYLSEIISRIAGYVVDSTKISIYVQLALIPLVIYHFGEFSIISLLVSIALTWLVPGIILLSFLLFFLKILEVNEILMRILVLPLDFLSKIFVSILKVFNNELFLIKIDNFSRWYILIYWMLLVIAFKILTSKKRKLNLLKTI